VLAQTYTDFELLILDDGSNDGSWDIINSYTDSRVCALQSGERNIVAAMNHVIADIAVGELIAIFHSDDVWLPTKLAEQVAYLDTYADCGAVFTQTLAIGEDGEPLTGDAAGIAAVFAQPNRSRQLWLQHFFYRMNALCHPSVLIRKAAYQTVGMYRETMWALADFDLWVRVCLSYEIHVLESALTCFRVRADHGNMSGDKVETHVRTATEFFLILRHYLHIDSFDELVAIFPEAAEYARPDGCEPKFILAMLALADNSFQQTKLFGLALLCDLLEEPESAQRIRQLYGFRPADFHALKIQHDVFSIKKMREAHAQIADLRRPGQALPRVQVADSNGALRLWGDDPRLFSQVGVRTAWGELETMQREGFLMYGPYITVLQGQYRLKIRGSVGPGGGIGAWCDVFACKGIALAIVGITEADESGYLVVLDFELTEDCNDLEFRIWVGAANDLRVALIELVKIIEFA
jgi:hypothetical protein